MSADPHAVVVRRVCPDCGELAFDVVAVPKLATGELYPQFGKCGACGWLESNMTADPPILENR
jgi:hypothetical protein